MSDPQSIVRIGFNPNDFQREDLAEILSAYSLNEILSYTEKRGDDFAVVTFVLANELTDDVRQRLTADLRNRNNDFTTARLVNFDPFLAFAINPGDYWRRRFANQFAFDLDGIPLESFPSVTRAEWTDPSNQLITHWLDGKSSQHVTVSIQSMSLAHPLELEIDPGEASVEDIRLLLSAFGELAQAHGAQGIQWTFDGNTILVVPEALV